MNRKVDGWIHRGWNPSQKVTLLPSSLSSHTSWREADLLSFLIPSLQVLKKNLLLSVAMRIKCGNQGNGPMAMPAASFGSGCFMQNARVAVIILTETGLPWDMTVQLSGPPCRALENKFPTSSPWQPYPPKSRVHPSPTLSIFYYVSGWSSLLLQSLPNIRRLFKPYPLVTPHRLVIWDFSLTIWGKLDMFNLCHSEYKVHVFDLVWSYLFLMSRGWDGRVFP